MAGTRCYPVRSGRLVGDKKCSLFILLPFFHACRWSREARVSVAGKHAGQHVNGAKGVEAVLAVWLGYCGSFKFTRNSLATGVFLLRGE